MMKMMIPPQWFHPFEGRIPGMNGIMHGAIHQIPQYKSGEKNEGIFFHCQVHDTEYGRRNDNTGNRRHEKTFFIPGKMMMISVQYIDKFLSFFTFCYCVKRKPVHQILEEGPEKTTSQKVEKNLYVVEIQPKMTQIYKIYNDRHIHPPNHQRVGFGQHFHVTVPEKLGLTFIMNLFKLHFTDL
jgi:hypothetical protein